MSAIEVISALFMLVGLLGIVVPVLPGLMVVWAGVLLWSLVEDSATGWWVLGIATALMVLGFLLEYLIPGRRMRQRGVRTSTLLGALVVAIGCAVVLPIAGFFLGFPVGIYLVERLRRGNHAQAWTATRHALRAIAANILIELATAALMIGTWVVVIVWIDRT